MPGANPKHMSQPHSWLLACVGRGAAARTVLYSGIVERLAGLLTLLRRVLTGQVGAKRGWVMLCGRSLNQLSVQPITI
jgi:hypothetical protein